MAFVIFIAALAVGGTVNNVRYSDRSYTLPAVIVAHDRPFRSDRRRGVQCYITFGYPYDAIVNDLAKSNLKLAEAVKREVEDYTKLFVPNAQHLKQTVVEHLEVKRGIYSSYIAFASADLRESCSEQPIGSIIEIKTSKRVRKPRIVGKSH